MKTLLVKTLDSEHEEWLFSVPSVWPTVLEDLFHDLWLLFVKQVGEY